MSNSPQDPSPPESTSPAALAPAPSTQHSFGIRTLTVNGLKSPTDVAVLSLYAAVNGQVVTSQPVSLGVLRLGKFDVSQQAAAQIAFTASPTDQVVLAFQLLSVASPGEASQLTASARQVIQSLPSFVGIDSAWQAIQDARSQVQPPFSGCEGFLAADKLGTATLGDLAAPTLSARSYTATSQNSTTGCSLSDVAVSFNLT